MGQLILILLLNLLYFSDGLVKKDLETAIIKTLSRQRRQEIDSKNNDKCSNNYVKPFQLPTHYSQFEFPTARDNDCSFEKVPITVAMHIRNIRGIAETQEELSMELDLITTWRDYLLRDLLMNKNASDFLQERGTDYIALESSFINSIWTPDIIFSKAIRISKPAVHTSRINYRPARLKIYPEGWVEIATRLVVYLYCPMDFTYFPADTQSCDVRIRSYAFNDNDIQLKWHHKLNNLTDSEVEAVFLYGRSHPNYNIWLHDVSTEQKTEISLKYDEDEGVYEPEHYTYLTCKISAKRKLSYHVTQTYIPSIFFVILTWLTFFIPISNLESRLGMAMTILLTMTNKFSSVLNSTPHVSYIKALDIYMMACLIVIFLTLLQFTFLYWIRLGHNEYSNSRAQLRRSLIKGRKKSNADIDIGDGERKEEDPVYGKMRNYIEVYGFLITIIGFILFNLFYWPWLILSSNYTFNDIDFNYNNPLG